MTKELNNFYILINYEARASWACFKYFLRTKIAEMTTNILTNVSKNDTFFFKYFHTKKWRAMMHEMCSLTTFLHSSNNSCSMYSINSKESEREWFVFKCMMWCVVMTQTINSDCLWFFICFWAYLSTVYGLIWALFLGLFERCFWAYLSAVYGLI